MLRFVFRYLICIFLMIPFSSFALSISGEGGLDEIIEKKFYHTVQDIVSINRDISKSKEQVILEGLYRHRETLTRYGQSLYRHILSQSRLTPTLDVSRRYRLQLQRLPLSCEIAALRMVVESIKKRPYTEDMLIRQIPHYQKPMIDGVWGDPDREFVGYYTGSQRLATGYGVYEAPLSDLLGKLGIVSRVSNAILEPKMDSHERLRKILSARAEGKHVILWGDWCTRAEYEDGKLEKIDSYIISFFLIPARNSCTRSEYERLYSWRTPTGKLIEGVSGEHAFLLLGYVGDIRNPTHIIVWDTDTGKHTYQTSEWMRKWQLLDYRALIIDDFSSSEKK